MASWRSVPEAGSVLGIRLVAGIYRLFGRTMAAGLLWCVAWYFTLFARVQRTAALDYFKRIGLPQTLGQVHKLIWSFARVGLDRLLFLLGDIQGLTVQLHGHDELMRLVREKQGALLLGAHLGSFEAMRTLASRYEVPLLVLVDFANAKRVTAMLQALAGEKANFRMLQLNSEDPLAMLEVKDAIDRGELVALLGDRRTDREGRDVAVPFFGSPAKFPVGPYVLAHSLQCPVYFVAGLFHAPARYDVIITPMTPRIELPRRGRQEAIEQEAARFAKVLEEYTRKAPLNWFNFFPFWMDS
ncbi:MAG: hypothetical protein ACO1OB_13650 [Archangium sp.]